MKTKAISGYLSALLLTSTLGLWTLCLSELAFANDPTQMMPVTAGDLPTSEKEFVAAIHQFDKKQIIEKLGEPSDADDVKIKGSDKVVASIWHYHYLNTSPDGEYYQTTELDFIDDKVVVVVFLNNDGKDVDAGQKYDVPDVKAKM